MYSVFLVEDEIVTREGIRNTIPWESSDYHLAGEAPDGEIALPAIRDIKPDILITDIKMPFMDGLELSRIVKRDQPWIKIIILSGHDEFQYAQKAISLGVAEYLLKPISSQEMLKSLKKVSGAIEEEKSRLRNLENLKNQIQSSEDLLKEKWLNNLVTGQISTVHAIDTALSMNIDLVGSGYVVMIVEVTSGHQNYSRLTVVKEIVRSLLQDRGDILFFPQSMDKLVFLAKNISRISLDEIIYTLAQGIKFEIERNSSFKAAVGIGSVVEHLEEIVQSYADADRAINYMRISGKKNIIGAGDVDWSSTGGALPAGGDHLSMRIQSAQYSEIPDIINQFIEALQGKGKGVKPAIFLKVLLRDIYETISHLVKELAGDPRELLPEVFEVMETSRNSDMTRDECTELIDRSLRVWIDFRDSRMHSSHHLLIQDAKRFIERNYNKPDLSLNDVASEVNLSPNHFSTVFSQEAGKKFIEYLTSVRIEKAKSLLLNSGMKCSDITYEVGYNDPHYFSYIFKKNQGVSPRDFRKTERSSLNI